MHEAMAWERAAQFCFGDLGGGTKTARKMIVNIGFGSYRRIALKCNTINQNAVFSSDNDPLDMQRMVLPMAATRLLK